MKPMMLGVAVFAAMAIGCAAENGTGATDDVSVQTAFYGLTVMDCQQQATQCFKANSGFSLLRRPVNCSVKLSACLAKAGTEAASNVVNEVKDVTTCGSDGLSCFADARSLRNVLSCEDGVESCVTSSVSELTGIPLPTTQQVAGAALETAGAVVESTAAVAGEVAEAAAGVTKEVVGAAVDVTGQVVETAAGVTGQVVGTAIDVTGQVVETAVDVTKGVVQTAAGAGVKAVKTALQCGEESRVCIRSTGKLLSCQLAYTKCLASR